MAIVSENIFRILKEKNMTQSELSKLTGIRESTISDWKNKGINPSSDKIMVICNALEIDPVEILSEDAKRLRTDYVTISTGSKEYFLIEAYRNMNAENKSRILGYLDALKM